MSLTRKIAHNTIIQFAGKMAGTILALITLSLTLRYLGAVGFGEYSVAVSYISIFAILIDLGLYLIVTREISKKNANESSLISNIVSFRFFVGGGILLMAVGVAYFFPYTDNSKILIAILSIAYLSASLSQILTGLFQKYLRMDKVSIAEIVGRVIWLAGVAGTVYVDAGIFWIALTNVFGAIANFVLLVAYSQKYIKLKPAFEFAIWKKLGKAAAPLAINVILNMVYFKSGIFFLTLLGTEEEVGILGAAMKILENLIAFSAIYAGLFFPLISRAINEPKDQLKKLITKSFDGVSLLAAPLFVGGILLAEEIIVFFGDAEFKAAAPALQLLMVAIVAIFFGNLSGNIVVAADKQKKLLPIYIGNAIVAVVLSLVLIPRIGYMGSALVTVITELVIAVSASVIAFKATKVKIPVTVPVKALLSVVVMGVVLYVVPADMHVLIKVVLGALVYGVGILVTKAATKKEIIDIFSPKKYDSKESN